MRGLTLNCSAPASPLASRFAHLPVWPSTRFQWPKSAARAAVGCLFDECILSAHRRGSTSASFQYSCFAELQAFSSDLRPEEVTNRDISLTADTIKASADYSRKNVKWWALPRKEKSADKNCHVGPTLNDCLGVSLHSICASRKEVGESDKLQELVGGNVEMVAREDPVHTSNEYGALTDEKVVSA